MDTFLFLKTSKWKNVQAVAGCLCAPDRESVSLQDEESKKVKEERLAAYNAKKAKSMYIF